MKRYVLLFFVALSLNSLGQSSELQERLQELQAKYEITESHLNKWAKLRFKTAWTDEKKQEKLASELAKLGFDSLDYHLVISDLVDQSPSALSALVTVDNSKGYSYAYLKLIADKMFRSLAINDLEYSFLNTIILAKNPENPAILKEDIKTAKSRIAHLESDFYTLDDYETMQFFDWNGYLDFTADLDVIQQQFRNIDGLTWDAFNNYMEEHGVGLGRASNMPQLSYPSGPVMQTALAFEFMEEVKNWRSFYLITEQHYKSPFENSPYWWSPMDFVKYRTFIHDPEVKKYLIQYMILQNWYHHQRKNFNDFNALAQLLKEEHKVNDPWKFMEKLEWEVEASIFKRFGHRYSTEEIIQDMGKDPFMSILVLYRNDLPLLPELPLTLLEKYRNLDENLLRLTDDEKDFIRMLWQMSEGNEFADKVLNHEDFEQFRNSKKMRFALMIHFIKMGFLSRTEWYYHREKTLYWEDDSEASKVLTSLDQELRTQQLNTGRSQILSLLDSTGVNSGQLIIQYFPDHMIVTKNIPAAIEREIKQILDTLFPLIPSALNYTRLSFVFMPDLKPWIFEQHEMMQPEEPMFDE